MRGTRDLQIRTPEGVLFTIPLASPVLRLLALCIDVVAVIGTLAVLRTVLAVLALVSAEFLMAVEVLIGFSVSLGYPIAMEAFWRGQTLGKRVLGIRVIDEHGGRLSFIQVVIRNLLRAVDVLPLLYFLGGVFTMTTRHAQRLGDLAAGTVVIKIEHAGIPDLHQISAGTLNSFRQAPHFEARVRRTILPREAALAVSALLRRNAMEDAPRLALFRHLAGHFRSLLTFPEHLTAGLSDEQLIRNLVDTLYRQPSDPGTGTAGGPPRQIRADAG